MTVVHCFSSDADDKLAVSTNDDDRQQQQDRKDINAKLDENKEHNCNGSDRSIRDVIIHNNKKSKNTGVICRLVSFYSSTHPSNAVIVALSFWF